MADNSNIYKGLLFGGIASCTAEVITLPIDVIKTRMQIRSGYVKSAQYTNSFSAVVTVVKNEGITALWKGLSPALLRQSIYGSMRYGFYTPFKKLLGVPDNPRQVPLWKKVLAGSAAGAISSVVANPTDLVKIRMQADGMAGTSARSYGGLLWAFGTIIKEEGVLGLWKGVGATCGRATALSAVELASYDDIKMRLLHAELFKEGLSLHLSSGLAAGFLASLASSPFDVVKSRIMQQPSGPDGKGLYYRGMTDCFIKSFKTEGISSLWRGFWPNYARVGPRVLIVFLVLEKLKSLFP
jgi:hypothetical protein